MPIVDCGFAPLGLSGTIHVEIGFDPAILAQLSGLAGVGCVQAPNIAQNGMPLMLKSTFFASVTSEATRCDAREGGITQPESRGESWRLIFQKKPEDLIFLLVLGYHSATICFLPINGMLLNHHRGNRKRGRQLGQVNTKITATALYSVNTVESQGRFGVTRERPSSNKRGEYVTNVALTGLVFAPYAISSEDIPLSATILVFLLRSGDMVVFWWFGTGAWWEAVHLDAPRRTSLFANCLDLDGR
jgi:hypothetical protein